jgi:TFIIF-interacting CTD phosphatase-like protein
MLRELLEALIHVIIPMDPPRRFRLIKKWRQSLRLQSLSIPKKKRRRRRQTLVLDLDETLVHATSMGLYSRHDFSIEVTVDNLPCLYYVYKRPYCDLFLRKVSEWYTVVVFTASMPEYADRVLDLLDPTKRMISRRLFRNVSHLTRIAPFCMGSTARTCQ